MKKFIAAIILILLGSAACASEPAKNFCGATDNMLSADYWIEHTKRARQTILTLEDTAALSRKIKDTPGTHCTDILA